MKVSLLNLEILLQDFKTPVVTRRNAIQANGQDFCMIDLETSIGTFVVSDMSSSFSNVSFKWNHIQFIKNAYGRFFFHVNVKYYNQTKIMMLIIHFTF